MEQSQIDFAIEEIRAALESGHVLDAIAALIRLHPVDRAEAFSDLDDEDQARLLPSLDIPTTADLLEELEDPEAADVAEGLPTELLADVLDKMEPDEAADVLGDISPERAAEALAEMEDAEEVIPLLEHPDETAGGLMTTSYIALRPSTTAEQAIEFLRQVSPDEETPYYLNVIDRERRLVGIVGLRDLVIASPEAHVDTLMDKEVIYVTTDTDQEDVARLMVRYDLAALPVVDQKGVLWGVITYDDLMDVLEAEATEDLYRLANIPDPDLSIESPVSLSVRRRLPWLLVSATTAFFASWVISQFESIIAQVALLAVFLSVVAGLGGNSATQSLAIMVRAIALGEIQLREAWRTILKEALTGLLQGAAVGAIAGLGVFLWKGNPILGLVLGLALLGNILVAGIVGTMIPLILKGLKMDPALASSVLVTTVTDAVGFALFLGLATIFLPYLK
ncbi:MAG: magnesium transporter [Anaerolineales bacterium]|nr:magnesium transporter [Anaerolineales bacterium]